MYFRIFDDEDRKYFRGIKLSDVIMETTNITDEDIQQNVFFWVSGDPCEQKTQLNATKLEPCPFLTGYDYFQVHSTILMD